MPVMKHFTKIYQFNFSLDLEDIPIIAIIDTKSATVASGPNSGTNVALFENAIV